MKLYAILIIVISCLVINYTDSYGFIIVILVAPILSLFNLLAYWLTNKYFKNKLFQYVILGAPSIVVASLYIFSSIESNSPSGTYERHFKTLPQNGVELITKSGGTALAGSFETLVFKLEQSKLETILSDNNFTEGLPKGIESLSERYGDLLKKHHITPGIIFSEGDFMVHRIVVYDKKNEKAILIYMKV